MARFYDTPVAFLPVDDGDGRRETGGRGDKEERRLRGLAKKEARGEEKGGRRDIALLETRRKRKVQSTVPGCSQSAEQRRQETMQPSRLQSLRSLPRNLIEPNLLVSLFTVPSTPGYVRTCTALAGVCVCTLARAREQGARRIR